MLNCSFNSNNCKGEAGRKIKYLATQVETTALTVDKLSIKTARRFNGSVYFLDELTFVI